MLSVDFSTLECQLKKMYRLTEMIEDLEIRINSKCVRLLEMSKRDGLSAPLKDVLQENLKSLKDISENVNIFAEKLKLIIKLYSDNENELNKYINAVFIYISKSYMGIKVGNSFEFINNSEFIDKTSANTSMIFSNQIINSDWLYTTMGDWRK